MGSTGSMRSRRLRETRVLEIRGGAIAEHTLTPGRFRGSRGARRKILKGADKETNRDIALEILQGASGPKRDIVLVNAAVALVAAGRASDFRSGTEIAAKSIDQGHALRKLKELASEVHELV